MQVVAYARYSSDNQREESIDAQVRAIEDYCAQNKYALSKVYIDEAKSATTDDRPQFKRMIDDAKHRSFSAVIVHKLDRFARNRYDHAYYRKKLKEHGIRVFSVLEKLDDSPESIILESVLEGMTEYYSKNLAREVRKGMKENAIAAKFTGGTIPLGYDVVDGYYQINESEAAAIRMIFGLVLSGKSYGYIIEYLNAYGYKTKRGQKFGKNSIYEILRNPKYMGRYEYIPQLDKSVSRRKNQNKIIVEDAIPAIVSAAEFEKVQALLSSRTRSDGGRATAKNIYLLAGKIFCGSCGGTMQGNTVRARGKYESGYYICSRDKHKKDCPAPARVRQKEIESDVLEIIISTLNDRKLIKNIAKKTLNYAQESRKAAMTDKHNFKRQLSEIEKKINNIVNAIADGNYSPIMKEKLTELEETREHLQVAIREDEIANEKFMVTEEMIYYYLDTKLQDLKNEDPDNQKTVIRDLLKNVTVYPENRASIGLVLTAGGSGEALRAAVKNTCKYSLSYNVCMYIGRV